MLAFAGLHLVLGRGWEGAGWRGAGAPSIPILNLQVCAHVVSWCAGLGGAPAPPALPPACSVCCTCLRVHAPSPLPAHTASLTRPVPAPPPVHSRQVPKAASNVPSEVLLPSNCWADKENYTKTLTHLAELFVKVGWVPGRCLSVGWLVALA